MKVRLIKFFLSLILLFTIPLHFVACEKEPPPEYVAVVNQKFGSYLGELKVAVQVYSPWGGLWADTIYSFYDSILVDLDYLDSSTYAFSWNNELWTGGYPMVDTIPDTSTSTPIACRLGFYY